MINMFQNEVEFKYKAKNEPYIVLKFDGKEFTECDINRHYKKQDKPNNYVEFLPGVYFKEKRKYKTRFIETINQQTGSLLQLIKLLFYWILDKLLVENQEVEIAFKICNKRDNILIIINNEVIFSNSSPIEDKYLQLKFKEKDLDEYDYIPEYKHVDTTKILYPFGVGGDGNRCRIKGIFQELDLLGGFHEEEYVFFNEHEMFLASSNIENLMDECKKFKNCMEFYESYLNITYLQPSPEEWGDNIKLEEFNGVFKISNANHRVCCAKRFKIPTVYAKVYNYSTKKEKQEDQKSYLNFMNRWKMQDLNKGILRDFYETLQKLGLQKEEGWYILNEGLRGTNLIRYIEETKGKTLYQLLKSM